MSKLRSSTDKSEIEVSPDGHSIIMRSISNGNQVYWPLKDWPDMRRYLDMKYEEHLGPTK
jgi:hypothetical protein